MKYLTTILSTIHRATAFVMLGLVSSTLACAATPDDLENQLSRYNEHWQGASENSLQSMIIGNGDIGLNAWVNPKGELEFFIGKTDSWDANMRLLKLGKVIVQFTPALPVDQTLEQELKLIDGVWVITTGERMIKVWVDANHPVVQVDVQSLDGETINAKASFHPWRIEERSLGEPGNSRNRGEYFGTGYTSLPAISYPDVILKPTADSVGWYHRNKVSPWMASLKLQKNEAAAKLTHDPLLNLTSGAIMQGKGWKMSDDKTLTTSGKDQTCSLNVHILTQQTDTAELWQKAIIQQAANIAKLNADERFSEHRDWWKQFWDRSWIFASARGTPLQAGSDKRGDSAPERVTRAYTLQRWVMACGGRGNSPIKFNGSIFVVDNAYDADYRKWGGGYWFQNTRLTYWPMLTSGDHEMMKPLFKLYMDALPARKIATQAYYQHDGAFFPETMSLWGNYLDRADVGYGRDRAGKADGTTQNEHIRLHWNGGLELAAMMFDYADHSGDDAFRQEKIIPFVHEIVTFYDQHYPRDEKGKFKLYPGYAQEDIWNCTNPASDLAGLMVNLESLIKHSKDAAKVKEYRRFLSEIPPLPIVKDAAGITRFAPAEPPYERRGNTEKPELYATFPFLIHGVGRDHLDMAKQAWEHAPKLYSRKVFGGWSQDRIFTACLGLTDQAKSQIVKFSTMVQAGSRFGAFWHQNHDWMPDQDHGGVQMIATQKMLIQYDRPANSNRIFLLPAWPEEWDVSFKLHAPLDTTIEGIYRDGKMQQLKVTPESRRKDIILP